MQQFSVKLITISVFFLAMNFSVAGDNNGVKVFDRGTDGGMRLYNVTCPNKKTTVIGQIIETSSEQSLQQEVTILPDAGSTSIGTTVQNLKDKALELVGQQNRSKICIYYANTEECKNYKDVDSAAQVACDLIR